MRDSQKLPGVRSVRLGSFLAYSLTRPRHRARAALNKAIRQAGADDPILLCFGELDCRCHVVKIATASKRSIVEVADELGACYVRAARRLLKGRPIAFWCAPPTTVHQVTNAAFPAIGTVKQRRTATRAFNAAIAREATNLGIPVIDISDQTSTRDGSPNAKLFPDDVHLCPVALPIAIEAFGEAGLLAGRSLQAMLAAGRRLAKAPAPPEAYAPALEFTTDAARKVDRAARACVELGVSRIALFGAGLHTEKTGLDHYRRHGLRVLAILDDRARPGQRLLGVPVLKPSKIPTGVRGLVISSDAHEDALAARARAIPALRGLPIFRIYSPR